MRGHVPYMDLAPEKVGVNWPLDPLALRSLASRWTC